MKGRGATTSPRAAKSWCSWFNAGAVAVQYGESVEVNQRINSTLPRSEARVSGGDPIQSATSHSGAGLPTRSPPSPP